MREEALLQHVYAASQSLPGTVTIPPGDDMGAVRIGGAEVLVTVDQLAAGVHADLATTSLARFARKAIARNLSDVAAMAAKPSGAVVAACLPRGFGESRATELFDAMRAAAEAFGCPLVGGDISMWDQPLIVSVTVFAEADGITPVLRQGARPGDAIYVTGTLGGSLEDVAGYVHHLDFTPRVALARHLADNPATRPHAMIDLSDGLAKDLPRVCAASGVRAVVEAEALPISRGGAQAAARSGQPAWQHAVGDGEDYELLFTADPGAISAEVEGVPITRVGRVEPAGEGPAVRLVLPDGSEADLTGLGWEHHG